MSANAHQTAEDCRDRTAIARRFIDSLPHSRSLGIRLGRVENGHAQAHLPWAPQLCQDATSRQIHSGAIAVLLDTASGAAVMAHRAGPDVTATLDLRIEHLRSPSPSAGLRAEAECLAIDGAIAFVRVLAFEAEGTQLIAQSNGVFTLEYQR